jgi:hypothetical protein
MQDRLKAGYPWKVTLNPRSGILPMLNMVIKQLKNCLRKNSPKHS